MLGIGGVLAGKLLYVIIKAILSALFKKCSDLDKTESFYKDVSFMLIATVRNSLSATVNVGVKLSVRQKEILEKLKATPTLTAEMLSKFFGVAQRTIERDLRTLKENGILDSKIIL